ncbi:MAG: hypothetical protein JXR31_16930 [Prolixibacteraceae bacterium]|nr:hypothetical protein [Prolixibacteraceae bacterium]MBN2775943.1 hypothetical protein [Prolixibacteraceae bacterium]
MGKRCCNKHYKILIFFILFFSGVKLYCQNFSDRTYLISDLTTAPVTNRIIQNELSSPWTGLYIQLEYNSEEDDLMLSPVSEGYSFKDFAGILKNYFGNANSRILPLIVDYTGPVRVLNDAIVVEGLNDFIFYLPPGERWPEVEKIREGNKKLVIFTFQKPNTGNSFFHYSWDYLAEYPHSGIEDPLFDGHYINGDITKELLLIRDFEIPSTVGNPSRLITELNQNQYYINHLLNRWRNTGKRPNFIFAGRNSLFLSALIPWLNTYKSVKGIVRVNDKPMEKVYWKHSNKCITNGYFSFPYSEGEELNLTPFSPGFRFDPQTSVVSNENLLMSVTFNASPLSLNEGLTAYFPFDNGWKNYLDEKEVIKPVNTTITSDINKGEVAKLPDNSFIEIGKPEKYGIKNNSFSVSAWFKLNEADISKEYSILGTNEGVFRKGLHLVIRQGRPYFGFYGNDLWADKVIPPNEWFHIVFRYNYFNGEQAIYINGQNIGSSFNHASFIGDSALVIGQSINSGNYLNGYIDDLYIWNRPLGEEEIQFLYNSDYKPVVEEVERNSLLSWIIPGFGMLIIFFILIILYFRKRKKQKFHSPESVISTEIKQKNAVYLFGDFLVFDAKGNELSSGFTPKIKELFLLVLLFTVKNKKGIKTEKLTEVLWSGFPAQKAANNRSVSINKLRKLIENVKGLDFVYNKGYWKVKFDSDFYCDYLEAAEILKKQNDFTKQDMEKFFNLVKKGIFLNELNWDWLENFRGHIVNEIIDTLSLFAETLDEKDDCRLLKAIAERILIIDDLNEKAMQIVIVQLLRNNNLNQARFRFSQFISTWEQSYGESYKLSFDEFRVFRF